MEVKQRYRDFCDKEPTVPLFSRAWWLDAVAGPEQWDVALAEGPDGIRAALPYVVRKRFGQVILGMPDRLTQTLGPWLRRQNAPAARQLAVEKDLLDELISRLPRHGHYSQAWHYRQTNWLPFSWHGFDQTTRYTYRLDTSLPVETLWGNLQSNIRTDIRKAETRFQLQVKSDGTIDELWKIVACSFSRQKQTMPYSLDLVRRIDAACHSRGARRLFVAVDPEGRAHAGAYIVWDDETAYYLMGGGDPGLRNSGAGSLCLWHAILFAGDLKRTFDFEGSMIEPIERYFRAFGATQTPYFSVSRTTSCLLAAIDGLRKVWHQCRGAIRCR